MSIRNPSVTQVNAAGAELIVCGKFVQGNISKGKSCTAIYVSLKSSPVQTNIGMSEMIGQQ